MIIDTHTHLYDEQFSEGGIHAVQRAIDAGVERMVIPATHPADFPAMQRLLSLFPENVFLAYGIHPTEIPEDYEGALRMVENLIASRNPGVVAVGEIGIDLYWEQDSRELQMQLFRRQCELALRYDLPVIIHCREGLDEALEVLGSLEEVPRGVFHCFCGTPADVERIRKVGDFYFGIGGVLTFKNSKLSESLPAIGLDRILLETDSPYLAPVPHRGKRNESAFLPSVAAKVADVLGVPLTGVEEETSHSAMTLFGLI